MLQLQSVFFLPTTHYKGLIVSPLHLLVPLVAGTQGLGRVINELVAHYSKTMEKLAKGLEVQVWCQRRLAGISGNMTSQSYHLPPFLACAVISGDRRAVIPRDTHSPCECMAGGSPLDGGVASC